MAQAQAVYRNVLRSAQLAFQGDSALLTAAKQQLRDEFRKNASLQPNDPALAAAIEHAQGVAQILRANIVQGKNEGDNKYRFIEVSKSTVKTNERIGLRIHDDTERGDNDTIKMPGGQVVTIDGKKCTDA